MKKKFSDFLEEKRTKELVEVLLPIINLDPHVKIIPVMITTRAQLRRFNLTGKIR